VPVYKFLNPSLEFVQDSMRIGQYKYIYTPPNLSDVYILSYKVIQGSKCDMEIWQNGPMAYGPKQVYGTPFSLYFGLMAGLVQQTLPTVFLGLQQSYTGPLFGLTMAGLSMIVRLYSPMALQPYQVLPCDPTPTPTTLCPSPAILQPYEPPGLLPCGPMAI